MLPLVLFAILFAAAASRVSEGPRETLVGFFRGVSEAMTVLLSGIIRLAPARRLRAFARPGGSSRALRDGGASAVYVLVLSGLCLVLILGPAPRAVGPRARFAGPLRARRGAGPARRLRRALFAGLAACDARRRGARPRSPEARLAIRPAARGFDSQGLRARPLSHRGCTSSPASTGTAIPPGELFSLAVLSLVLSFSLPGVPHGAILVTAPVLAAAGLPTQAVALLLAVDAIPNAFRSAANSTGNMVVAAILGRRPRRAPRTASDAAPATPRRRRARSCLR